MKTFFGIRLAHIIANAYGPVFYSAGERYRSIGRRHAPAAARALGFVPEAVPFILGTRVPNLADADEVREYAGSVERCGGAKVIFLDTLARGMAHMDENAAGDIGKMVEALEYLRDRLKAAIVVIHHSSEKDQRKNARGVPLPRGSSALIGDFDALHYVERQRADHSMSVQTLLMKEGEEREEKWLYRPRATDGTLVLDAISEADLHRAQKSQVSLVAVLNILGSSTVAWSPDHLAIEFTKTLGLKGQDEVDAQLEAQKALRELAKNPALRELVTGSGATLKFRWPR